MKNNINKKVGATLLAAAIMAGTAVIPMSNAAVEAAAKETNKPSIEYIAHIQDWGWSKGWVNEGEMAGTEGEARRVEAIKIKMTNCEGVSLKFKAHIQDYGDREYTDASEIIGTVGESKRVEAITITSTGLNEKGYKLQYRVHIENLGWSQGWVNEGEMAGTMGQSLRLEAIEIRVVPMENVDDELATERAEALEEIARYSEIISNVEGLTAYDKAMLNTRIATAIASIENAKTAEEINEIKEALVNLIDDNYGLELAKAEAITEIKAYLDGASEGLTSYIEEQIEAIREESKIANITKTKTTTINACRDIITKQSYANQVFDIYSKTLEEVEGILPSEKTVIRSRISEDREKVAKAESASVIETIVDNFEDYMNSDVRYEEIVKKAEKAIETATEENNLKTAINNAITKFEEAINKKYGSDKEGMKLAKEYKGEYIEKLQNIKEVSEVNTKLTEVQRALDAKIKDAKDYTTAYNSAVTRLKDFERIVPTLELSNETEIMTYIEQTKAIVSEAKTASEINSAMARFAAYMESFDINFDAELDADEVKQAAITSKTKLNEYVNSDIDKVSQLAKDAIEEIDEIMENENATVEKIEQVLENAITEINNERLYAAQSEAYNKLIGYKDAGEQQEVIEKAGEAIKAIVAVEITNTVDVEKAIETVNEELAKALKEINKILGNVTTDARDEFNKAKANLIAELREYRNMATELGDTVAVRKVNEYIDVITDMTYEADFTIADLEAKKVVFENDMESSKAVKNKVTAIRTLQGYMKEENNYLAEKAQVNSVINKAIVDIKAVKAPADAEDVVDAEKIIIDEIIAEVNKLRTKYADLDAARDTKIETLTSERNEVDTTVERKIAIDNKIKEIKAIVLDLSKKDDVDDPYGLNEAKDKLN